MPLLPTEARDPRTYAVIGAAMAVHTELGCGFLERAYQEALAVELAERLIPFAREVDLPVYYKGVLLDCRYRADFIRFGEVIVETKAEKQLSEIDRAQVINYLRATATRLRCCSTSAPRACNTSASCSHPGVHPSTQLNLRNLRNLRFQPRET